MVAVLAEQGAMGANRFVFACLAD
jgi:hypothetical protein